MRSSRSHPVLRDLRRRLPEKIGRAVFVAAGVVAHRVVLDAARVRQKEDGGLPVVARVEDDAGVVGGAGDVVAIGERRADLLRIRILEMEGRVEEMVVVRHPGHVLHLRLGVVGGVGLVPLVDAQRVFPGRVGEIAVDRDRTGGALDVERRRRLAGLGVNRGRQTENDCDRQQTTNCLHGR